MQSGILRVPPTSKPTLGRGLNQRGLLAHKRSSLLDKPSSKRNKLGLRHYIINSFNSSRILSRQHSFWAISPKALEHYLAAPLPVINPLRISLMKGSRTISSLLENFTMARRS